MTNEEAKAFLDNLKICINEHPIVADWLVEIADRKTEPTISKMEQVDGECADCKWHDKEWWYIKCDGCSRLHSHFEPKDEPQTYVINPQEPTNDDKCFECDDFFTCGGQCNKIEDEPTISKMEQVDEPTGYNLSPVEDEPQYDIDKGTIRCDNCSENGSYKCSKCDGEMYFKRLAVEDEPQTDCSWK